MKKWLLKLFMPTAEDVATMATNAIAKFINESGKEEVIAKYGTIADEFTQIQSKVTGWLKDGKIDDGERLDLYNALLPIADKVIEEVKR